MSVGADVNLGGSGGEGSTAGNVSVTSSSDISTGAVDSKGDVISGDFAYGILAQSVGGGGGNGGSTRSYSAAISNSGSPVSLGASIGGSGAEGGTSGDVDLNISGTIVTRGFAASGVVAQSIGGGGGAGGSTDSVSNTKSLSGQKTQGNICIAFIEP